MTMRTIIRSVDYELVLVGMLVSLILFKNCDLFCFFSFFLCLKLLLESEWLDNIKTQVTLRKVELVVSQTRAV